MTNLLMAAKEKKSKRIIKGTAVAYYRVSTTAQELSPEAQKSAVHQFCQAKGINLVGEFTEIGVSGAADLVDRPELLAAMQRVSEMRCEYLVVLRQDRLSRSVETTGFIDYALSKSGSRVLPVEGDTDSANPLSSLMKSFQVAMAAQERMLIASRTKSALGQLKQQGKRVSRFAPFGYEFDADNNLVENASEQGVIATIKELAAQGMGGTAIAKELSKKGVKNRAGNQWSAVTMHQLMRKVL